LRRRVPACGSVAARENCHGMTERKLSFGVHARSPRRIVCRAELGRRGLTGSLPVPMEQTLCEFGRSFQDQSC
jgi:hypothetical protein